MDSPNDWWKAFFSGLWLEAQKQGAETTDNEAESRCLYELLGLQQGSRVLDVPCGEGRHALQLAQRGCQLTGVDITEELLDLARSRAKEIDVDITWHHDDMRALPWQQEFDAAYCMGSFGFFDDAGHEAFVKGVGQSLRPGGKFLLEAIFTAERWLPQFQERTWWRAGDVICVQEQTYNYVESRLEIDWTLIHDGKQEEKPSSFRVYTYHELTEMLKRAGFGEIHAYSSLQSDPFDLGRNLILVATRLP